MSSMDLGRAVLRGAMVRLHDLHDRIVARLFGLLPDGSLARISAAISCTTAEESRCVTVFQCRSMKTKATTDCSTTMGTTMISSARA